jgi:hypothetical protein
LKILETWCTHPAMMIVSGTVSDTSKKWKIAKRENKIFFMGSEEQYFALKGNSAKGWPDAIHPSDHSMIGGVFEWHDTQMTPTT